MMKRTHEHITSSGIRRTSAALVAAGIILTGCSKGSPAETESSTSSTSRPRTGPVHAGEMPTCANTRQSIADAKKPLRTELAEAVEQAVTIYNLQATRKMEYSKNQKLYKDLLRVAVPKENATINVQVMGSKPTLTEASLNRISTTIVEDGTNTWRMSQTISRDAAEGWRFTGSYLTAETSEQKTYTHYDATPGEYACVWSSELSDTSTGGTAAVMERRPKDAVVIANKVAGHMLVLTGAAQHLNPGATDYELPPVSHQIFEASDTPHPTAAVK